MIRNDEGSIKIPKNINISQKFITNFEAGEEILYLIDLPMTIYFPSPHKQGLTYGYQ